MARCCLALLTLTISANALWSMTGHDPLRSSTEVATVPFAPSLAPLLSTPLHAPVRFAPLAGPASVVDISACNVTFFSRGAGGAVSQTPTAAWSPCAGGGGDVPQVVAGAALARGGRECIVTTAFSNGTALAWGVIAAGDAAMGSVAWSVALPFTPVADALVLDSLCSIVWMSRMEWGAQLLFYVTHAGVACDGPIETRVVNRTAILCAWSDSYLAPLAAFRDASNAFSGFLTVSSQGAVTASDTNGNILWSSTRLCSAKFGGVVAAPPVIAADSSSAFILSADGYVCCVELKNLSACAAWSAGSDDGLPCTLLPSPTPPLAPGLALSPSTFDFHGGSLYAADSAGTVFVVNVASGIAGSSGGDAFATNVVVNAPPVLVVGHAGERYDALILIGDAPPGKNTPPTLSAFLVGDNGANGDDNAVDDDNYATIGPLWSLSLSSPGSASALSGGASAGAAVVGDAYVLVSTAAGLWTVTGNARPDDVPNYELEIVAFSSIAAGFVALAVVLGVVARQRSRRIARVRAAAEALDTDGDEVEWDAAASSTPNPSSASLGAAYVELAEQEEPAERKAGRVFALNSIM